MSTEARRAVLRPLPLPRVTYELPSLRHKMTKDNKSYSPFCHFEKNFSSLEGKNPYSFLRVSCPPTVSVLKITVDKTSHDEKTFQHTDLIPRKRKVLQRDSHRNQPHCEGFLDCKGRPVKTKPEHTLASRTQRCTPAVARRKRHHQPRHASSLK